MQRALLALCVPAALIAFTAMAIHCAANAPDPESAPPARDAGAELLFDASIDAAPSGLDSASGASSPGATADASLPRTLQEAGPGAAVDARPDAPAPLFSPCPPPGAACLIMPLGDSITFGYRSSTGGGYRLRLLEDIWAANHDATFVGSATSGPPTLDGKPFPTGNEGHIAYTIDDAPAVGRSGISPLVPASLAKYTPQIVTLMIGTNDVDTNNDLANAPTRLANLLDTITTASPNALLVVAQITPTGTDAENLLVQAYNAAIPGLVQTRAAAGKHVILVDMYAALSANPAYRTADMADGLHPNDTGYGVLGDAWYAALAPYL
jgi:lysophospholipase L1-like esterase